MEKFNNEGMNSREETKEKDNRLSSKNEC